MHNDALDDFVDHRIGPRKEKPNTGDNENP